MLSATTWRRRNMEIPNKCAYCGRFGRILERTPVKLYICDGCGNTWFKHHDEDDRGSDLKIIDIEANYDRIHVMPMGDHHIGLREFAPDKFMGYRQWILDHPGTKVILMGDIFETPINTSRVQDEPQAPNGMTVHQTIAYGYDLFAPIRDNIIGIVEGNHDYRASRLTGGSALSMLIAKLDLEDVYDPDQILVRINVDDTIYQIMAQHGWGGARKTGGQMNKMEEMSNIIGDADAYLTGHEHTLFMSRWDKDIVQGNDVIELRQVYVGCGCFCGLTRFQKRIARRKPNIGAPRLRLDSKRRDLHVSI